MILMNILFHSAQFIITLTRLATYKTCFYLELTQTILNFQPPLPLNGNLRNTSYMKKFPIMNLATFHLCRTKYCVFQYSVTLFYFLCVSTFFCNSVLFFVCIYFFIFSVCTFYAFRHEVHFMVFYTFCFFLFCFVFFCTSLISFLTFFTLFITIFQILCVAKILQPHHIP